MNARNAFSTLRAGLLLALLSLALFALPGSAFATDSESKEPAKEPTTEPTDTTTDPTAAQYAPPTQVVPPPEQPPLAQVPPPEKPDQPEKIQAGLGAGAGGGQPAEEVAVPVADRGPSLPFTGLDVAALAVVALALAGTGVVLRRLATIGDSEK